MNNSEQINIFEMLKENYVIKKPIRLIECFAGYGSQALALKYLDIPFEHYMICEWAIKSIQAYKDMHFYNDNTDYTKNLSDNEIIDKLYDLGVSIDYKNQATKEQIKRQNVRQIYNNIIATNNKVNVMKAELNTNDLDIYDYIMCYSFPCQSISNAGKRNGMEINSGTTSSMLWEIKRMLERERERELQDNLEHLPQILLMENVPQCIKAKGWKEWVLFLENLGYSNYCEILNAKNYGIPQNRERAFMLSIKGNYNFNFSKKIKLDIALKDILEKNVDEKYFLSSKQIEDIKNWKAYEKPLEKIKQGNDISPTITTRTSEYTSSMILINDKEINNNYLGTYQFAKSELFMKNKDRFEKDKKICNTLLTSPKEGIVLNESAFSETQLKMFDSNLNIKRYINSDIVDEFKENQIADISYPNGYNKGNRVFNECPTINTTTTKSNFVVKEKEDLRIRKMTSKECFRLMGVKDIDYERAKENQSESSLYHLAGDSIVSTCLMAIFGKILDIDYEEKIKKVIKDLKND